jgi:hypothetical protein
MSSSKKFSCKETLRQMIICLMPPPPVTHCIRSTYMCTPAPCRKIPLQVNFINDYILLGCLFSFFLPNLFFID